jgi:bacterioferritin
MKNQQTVKTLNNFLKGQFMGIHAYEQYIQKITDQETKTKVPKNSTRT